VRETGGDDEGLRKVRALVPRNTRAREACNTSSDPTTRLYTKELDMPSNVYLPDDLHYHDDLEAELYDRRYNMALQRLTVSDVLSVLDDMVRNEADERKHPLFHLVRHSLRYGTCWSSGKRCHFSELLGAAYEDMIEIAIERLIAEELANFGPWED
jgi:hypothetical protein